MSDFFAGKKVLVTGASGFIGTNTIKDLLLRGAKVRGTTHKKEPSIQDDSIEYVNADLTLKEDCAKAVAGMDIVIMCAANTSGAAVIEKTPLVHVTPNVVMNALMLEAAYAAGVKKYVWLSSNTVYPETDHPVKESEMLSGPPFEKYFFASWMKRFGEIMCEMYSKVKNPMATVVVRPANVYGEHDDFEWETSHVIPALVRKAVEGQKPLEVWGDGTEIKDLIYIGDFVEGLLLATEKINTFDPINIGTGKQASIKQALEIILKECGRDIQDVVFDDSKPTMIKTRLIDVSKAERDLGFKAKTSLQDGLKKTVEWYKQNRV